MTFPDEPYSPAEKLVIDQVRRDVEALDKPVKGAKPARTIVSRKGGHCDVNLSKQGLTRLPLAILQQVDQYVER
jgi:hypothetical protein